VKGIVLEVWFKEKKLEPGEDGYLGEFSKGNFQLKYILPEKDSKIVVFTVDGKKNILPMKATIKTVPISQDGNGVFTTQYTNNNIRLAVFGQKGRFEIWEIAIVSQGGVFFLTEQRTYESQWFRGQNGEYVCPDFEKWPQLIELLKPIMEKEELPPVAEYSPPLPKTNGLLKGQGQVVWYNLVMQMGCIRLDDKGTVARVHWKSLPPNMNGGPRKLEAGQLVSYRKLLPVPQTTRATSFSMEVREVTPL